jgi:hypothetical protein
VRGVDLDPVDPAGDLFADFTATAVGAVTHADAGRECPVGPVAEDWVGAGSRERAPGDLEARPWHNAFVDGVSDADVVVACALGPEVTQAGEASLER